MDAPFSLHLHKGQRSVMPHPVAKVFGARVKALRVAKGLTQEQLGEKAGLDGKHVGAIERGVKASSFDAINQLAKALGVEYYQLFMPTSAKPTDAVVDEISAMVRGANRIDAKNVGDFLKELRTALRKLSR